MSTYQTMNQNHNLKTTLKFKITIRTWSPKPHSW